MTRMTTESGHALFPSPFSLSSPRINSVAARVCGMLILCRAFSLSSDAASRKISPFRFGRDDLT